MSFIITPLLDPDHQVITCMWEKKEDICNIYLHSAESRSTTYSKERADSCHGLFKFALIFTSPTKLSKEIEIHDLFAWT